MPPQLRLFPLLLLLAACSSKSGGQALSQPEVDTLPNGVVQVTNTGPSAWADTNGWRLVEERTIVPEEGSPGELSRPQGLAVDVAGNIYVLQSGPTLIKAYAPDGTWLRNIGRDGDGPGEFRDGTFGIVRDTIFVQDPNNSRLTTFTTDGQFVQTSRSQCCWWASQFPIFSDGTVGIFGPATGDQEGGAIYLTRLDGLVVDTISVPVTPPDPTTQWTVTLTRPNSQSSMGVPIPLQPSDKASWFRDRKQVGGHTVTYRLAITGLHGDTLRTFTAPSPSFSITEVERDSTYEAQIERVSPEWRDAMRAVAKKSDLATTWPAWSGVAVDQAARIWIARPGTAGEVSVLDVFTPDGVLLGSVPSPDRRILDGYWTTDRVYLLGETEEGLPQIRVFRIDQSGAP